VARYFGLDRHIFDRDVRSEITELRHGRAVLFDRLELDVRADYNLARGRPPERRTLWQEEIRLDCATDRVEAERYLGFRLNQIRQDKIYGEKQPVFFGRLRRSSWKKTRI
jgi:hypothetical protein